MTLIKFFILPSYAGFLFSNYMITGNWVHLVSGMFASIVAVKIKRGD